MVTFSTTPHWYVAERAWDHAQSASPCSRANYGAAILDSNGGITFGSNIRMGYCCTNKFCIRDHEKIPSGSQIERGAEIHAEMDVLIKWRGYGVEPPFRFYLVGGTSDKYWTDGSTKPCHMCALMIKAAGFNWVWIPEDDIFVPRNIHEIIKEAEANYGYSGSNL